MYDVVVEQRGGWATDLTTHSRRYAVERARRIAQAWPWERRKIVRIVHGLAVVDFNVEP